MNRFLSVILRRNEQPAKDQPAKVEQLQRHSDATLVRASQVARNAERDRLASAVANTARAVRIQPRRGRQHEH